VIFLPLFTIVYCYKFGASSFFVLVNLFVIFFHFFYNLVQQCYSFRVMLLIWCFLCEGFFFFGLCVFFYLIMHFPFCNLVASRCVCSFWNFTLMHLFLILCSHFAVMLMDPFFSKWCLMDFFFPSARHRFYLNVHVHHAFNMVMNNNVGLVIIILVLLVEILWEFCNVQDQSCISIEVHDVDLSWL
jgi:hypothetical protein